MPDSFDIVVVGSGIAGSVLALALQRAGLRTACIERKKHPRFVIGESTVPTTSFLFKQIAAEYGIPELGEIAHYLGLRGRRLPAWPKQGFWHGCHVEKERLSPDREQFLEGLHLPIGPDVHMLRADVDAFLVSLFPRYGVHYEDDTEITDFETTPSGVKLEVRGPAGERTIGASLVVDASGHASFFARRFGLRDEVARLGTDTRSIFSHYENVPPLDELLGGPNEAFRFRRDGGTMHHQFPGGWVWVIPFDSGITSVGVQFDRTLHPLDESVPAEEEIQRLLDRFPTIATHLGRMKPVRPVIRTDRLQFTSSTILGRGFVLTPHAAGFVEPLYSTGILLTTLFISRFVPAVQAAKAAGDWDTARFLPIERCFFAELEQIDRVVHGSILCFRNAELFKQYWRIWIIGTVAHLADCVLVGHAPMRPVLWGAGLEDFSAHLDRMYRAVKESRGEREDLALAARVHRETEPYWEKIAVPLMQCDDSAPGAGRGTAVFANRDAELLWTWLEKIRGQPETGRPDMKFKCATRWLTEAARLQKEQIERWVRSREAGTDEHRALERILDQHNPARFDYYEEIGARRAGGTR